MQFEPTLRSNIIAAARDLNSSPAGFATFKKSFCNEKYWTLTSEGGFQLRDSVMPAEAIQDIFSNGKKYGFECATAIIIVLYKAVLDTLGETPFNRLFQNLYLHSWQADSDLGLITEDAPSEKSQPGDVLYFKNPDVNPDKMEWQGENVVKLGDDLYFGHGIGIKSGEGIIASLNKRRIEDATKSAYLEDRFVYPDFYHLSQYAPADIRLYYNTKWPNPYAAVGASIGVRRYIRH
ncbi:protein-glutamine gamma-glutamyltransferase [Paenibacillus sp. BC26]|uniref:protein-glutamine gamma-glutamyltransferase n=1 Tax=Paenibacillus sp. BC26 TaxID=1881032 RepID=UPI0008E862C5|nr:protein-glutamine gamma-glutamyltransferase [Paenibacillus sp. BC26]SFT09595.1 protein-glutamine gamma-glutamyltransferase [Paenibacillus sp. BC26]